MGNWRLPLHLTGIVGRSDFGKTTFAFRYIYNFPAACRFLFDDQGRDASRLEGWNIGIRPCFTANELDAALATRWVVFNPTRMFPNDPLFKKAFNWFCGWVYDRSTTGPGKKFFLVNEIWRYQDRGEIPPNLAKIVQAGREEDIELVFCTQTPQDVNAAIMGQCTELVTFRVGETDDAEYLHLDPALRKVQALGIDAASVLALPKGSFIALDKLGRSKLAGKVF